MFPNTKENTWEINEHQYFGWKRSIHTDEVYQWNGSFAADLPQCCQQLQRNGAFQKRELKSLYIFYIKWDH